MAKKRKLKKPIKGCLTFIVTIAVLIAICTGGLYAYGMLKIVPDRTESAYEYRNDRINVLIVGTDQGAADEVGRADSLMVANVDLENHIINIISLPRDSRVEIPGNDKNKINHSYAYGGIDLTKQTVENLLEIPIDYYAITNFEGFETIVNILGGVDLYVEKDMEAHTYYGDINLKEGQQHLDPQQALGYVRYRYDAMGDVARAGRQQKFMKAVFEEAVKPTNLPKLPSLLGQIDEVIDTDLSTAQLLYLAFGFRGATGADVHTAVPECSFDTIGGVSYVILDNDNLDSLVQTMFIDDYDPAYWAEQEAVSEE
ncbi:MAG: LCP family protein [Bacillota bacterium]|jgi:LCP family protein required for cell wall assembly